MKSWHAAILFLAAHALAAIPARAADNGPVGLVCFVNEAGALSGDSSALEQELVRQGCREGDVLIVRASVAPSLVIAYFCNVRLPMADPGDDVVCTYAGGRRLGR